ncbi:MAG: hypothetical protein ACT4QC_18755 [Planctomycetaceae bacterium]
MAALLASGGCVTIPWWPTTDVAPLVEEVDYGPNPLGDCLRWPPDAPRQVPLYAP